MSAVACVGVVNGADEASEGDPPSAVTAVATGKPAVPPPALPVAPPPAVPPVTLPHVAL